MAKDTLFYKLRISEKVAETDDAFTLYFEIPDDLADKFNYKAGQYLTLKFVIDGTEERRSYSLCTRPGSGKTGVTVKLVKGGKVSTYIHNSVKAGDEIEVMPPDGRFTIEPDPEKRRTYYAFAAGSGITPLMSQILTILEDEPMSVVHLLYGNKTKESIIFREALAKLISSYGEQLSVTHTLSQVNKGGGIISSIFKKKQPVEWPGLTGRIDGNRVREFLKEHPAHNEESVYLICGPGNMIESVRKTLVSQGIAEDHILTEYFTAADSATKTKVAAGSTSKLKATLRGETIEIDVADKSILETLQSAGYDPPYSCTSGACASCMAKVTSGTVKMEMCFALDQDEIDEGYVLTCQSHPTSDEVELTYDV